MNVTNIINILINLIWPKSIGIKIWRIFSIKKYRIYKVTLRWIRDNFEVDWDIFLKYHMQEYQDWKKKFNLILSTFKLTKLKFLNMSYKTSYEFILFEKRKKIYDYYFIKKKIIYDYLSIMILHIWKKDYMMIACLIIFLSMSIWIYLFYMAINYYPPICYLWYLYFPDNTTNLFTVFAVCIILSLFFFLSA